MFWKKEYECSCGGNFVDPWELGFESDGCHLVCDNEDRGDGQPCERYIFVEDKKQYLKPNPLRRWWSKRFGEKRIWDIFSEDFHTRALRVTGVQWDFEKVKSNRCAVLGCWRNNNYGFWTCREHRELEFKHFDPVDEFGDLFYSHRGKKFTVEVER